MATFYVDDDYSAANYVQSDIEVLYESNIIYIPKFATTLIQTSPIEIRELDLGALRYRLRDVEDNPLGISKPVSINYSSPVGVGGVTLAAVYTILEPYTITFEDGQYAVNITGGNSNVADRINPNSVGVRTANSAGLVQTDEIENATYGGGISFDLNNGEAGSVYPIGTPARPVNNLDDVKLIQATKNLPEKLFINGFTNFGPDDLLDGWELEGNSNWNDHIHTFSGGIFSDCRLHNLHVAGSFLGLTTAIEARIGNATLSGDLVDCYFTSTTTLNGDLEVIDGNAVAVGANPIFDCAGAHDLMIRGFKGSLEVHNVTSVDQEVTIDITSGNIIIDASCTDGTIILRGSGDVVDNSNGATVITTGLIAEPLQHGSFEGGVTIDQAAGTAGTAYPIGTGRSPVNNITDALAIANTRGFEKMFIKGNLLVGASDSVSGFHMYGEGASLNVSATTVTLTDGCSTSSTHWHHCKISGRQSGEGFYHHCMIDGLYNAHCYYEECGLLTPNSQAFTIQQSTGPSAGHITYLTNCYSDEGTAVIDRAGVKESQRYSNWTGNIKFINQNNAAVGDIWIHMVGGSVEIDSSCTEGTFHITGDGSIINNTGGAIVKTGVLQKIDDARIAVESLRPTHQGYGDILYVDPINGNDANDGETQFTSVKTFARAHDLAHDGQNDVIQFINPSASGYVHNEDMLCTKNNIHLRSTSRDITFKAATPAGSILTIGDATGTNGYNCSAAGMLVDGDKVGAIPSNHCIVVNGKFSALNYMWTKQSVLDCIEYRGGDYHTILDGEIEKAGRHGVSTVDYGLPSGSPREISIYGRTNIYLNAEDGVHLGGTGASGSTTRIVRILGGEIANNGGFGIHADANVSGLTIASNVIVHSNNGGLEQNNILCPYHDDAAAGYAEAAALVWDSPLSDTTAGDILEHLHYQQKDYYIDAEAATNGIGTEESPFNNITDAIDAAEADNTRSLVITGDIELDRNVKNFTIRGIGQPKFEAGGFNLDGCELKELRFKGAYTGNIVARQIVLLQGSYVSGLIIESTILGDFTAVAGTSTHLKDCSSCVPNGTIPKVSFGVGAATNINMTGYNGSLRIADCSAGDGGVFNIGSGNVIIESSCTGGVIDITGTTLIVDSSTGTTVNDNTGFEVSATVNFDQTTYNNISDAVWNKALADMIVADSAGERLKALLTLNKYLALD